MKKLLLINILVFFYLINYAQIPNSGFENWTNIETTKPADWITYGVITKIDNGSGGKAIRLERDITGLSGPGAILFGIPTETSINGGIPFADRPDSLVLRAKYNINANDKGWAFVMLKKEGVPVSCDTFIITGNHTSDYVRLAFKITYYSNLTPDSLILAFTSTNPQVPVGNGYVILDTVYFTNSTKALPNSGFELWNNIQNEEPDGWLSSNMMFHGLDDMPVNKSTDYYSGNYAIHIENLLYQGYYQKGYALCGKLTNDGYILPGFPVSERFNMFSGYYKFLPQNGDKPRISIFMFKSGVIIGSGSLVHIHSINYTRFNIPISYNNDLIPDSAAILLIASDGGRAEGNSMLMVDGLQLFTGSVPGTAGAIKGAGNVCKKQSVTYSVPLIEGAEKYNWTLPSGAIGYSTTNSIEVTFEDNAKSGYILVTGENEFGKGQESFLSITVSNTCTSSVPNIATPQKEILFGPNPTTGIIKTKTSLVIDKNYNIKVYNVLGSEVLSLSGTSNIIPEINLSNQPNGLYLIKLETGNNTYQQKVIKK